MKQKYKRGRLGKTSHLGDVLVDLIDKYNLEKLFTIESIREIWSDIVGDIISTHSIPERIYNGIIYIAVDHSVFSNELVLMKDHIIKAVSEKCMNIKIYGIRVNVKRFDWKKSIK